MTHVRPSSVLATLLLAASAAACTASTDAAAPAPPSASTPTTTPTSAVRIALVGSFTGPGAPVGADVKRGADVAVDQINALGGVLGRRLELVLVDDHGTAATSAARLAELAEDGVVLGVGPTTNAGAEAVLPLVARDRVLLVSPSATSSTLDCVAAATAPEERKAECAAKRAAYDADGTLSPVLFRTSASDALLATALAQVASEPVAGARRCRSIAIVRQDDATGAALSEKLAQRYTQLNLAVRRSIGLDPEGASPLALAAAVEAVANAPVPDCQVVVAKPSVASAYMRAFKEWTSSHPSAFAPTFATVGGDGFRDPSLFTSPQSAEAAAAEGSLAVAPDTMPASPEYAAFRAAFGATHRDTPPGRFAATAYDAVVVLAGAITRAGSATSLPEVRRALVAVSSGRTPAGAADLATFVRLAASGEDVDYRGASGPLDFDPHTGGVRNDFGVWRIAQGAYVREATFDASVLSGD